MPRRLRPSEIRFTQDSVKNSFTKNDENFGKLIGETLDELCDGVCKVGDIATIKVFRKDGFWWSADNRRLWVLREFERLGGCGEIDVREISMNRFDWAKFTTKNSGTGTRVRGLCLNPGGRWYLKPDKAITVKINPKTRYRSERLSEPRQEYSNKIRDRSEVRHTNKCQIHKTRLHDEMTQDQLSITVRNTDGRRVVTVRRTPGSRGLGSASWIDVIWQFGFPVFRFLAVSFRSMASLTSCFLVQLYRFLAF